MVVNLDAKMLRFMSADEFRVLIATEMGMKNHEWVPTALIESIAGLKRGGVFKIIAQLAKYKLIAHASIPYDSYRLTLKGYDYLALKAFSKRGSLASLGIQIGVGKESDIFTVMTPDGEEVCLKLHRLGRTCFRTVKNNRDYMRNINGHASWMYLSRLSALKEYAFMKALHNNGFPVPTPIDVNRHCVVMTLANGYQLNSINCLTHPARVFQRLMDILIRLAEHGLIHGDFNEFNLLVNDEEEVTVIDFPQMISTSHINAEYYFNRDVNCVKTFFKRRFGFDAARTPTLLDDTTYGANREHGAAGLDEELRASGWTEAFSKDFDGLMKVVEEAEAEGGGEEDDEDDENDETDEEEDGEGEGGEEEEGATASAVASPTTAQMSRLAIGSIAADDEPDGLAASKGVDAAAARQEELAELAALAALALPSATPTPGVSAEAATKPPAAAEATASVAAAVPLVVDLSDPGAKLPPPLPLRSAPAVEPTPSEAAKSDRTTTSMRSTASARGDVAKERIKLELQQRAKKAASANRSTRNELKDRDKRRLVNEVKKERSGTSGW